MTEIPQTGSEQKASQRTLNEVSDSDLENALRVLQLVGELRGAAGSSDFGGKARAARATRDANKVNAATEVLERVFSFRKLAKPPSPGADPSPLLG